MTTHRLAELGFVLIAVAGLTFELTALRARRKGRPAGERPATLGEAVASALTTRVGQGLVLGWWWWLGWHFLAR